ncbi:MAG: phosphoribosyl-AMP cyclohydrolase [Planctomycetota bacterium]
METGERETGLTFQPQFNSDGLIGCIVQDAETAAVLMFAWMNAEALEKTRTTGRGTYYSRSRRKLWVKGESSGHVQAVVSLAVDCDQDVLLLKVRQTGAACHLGYRSCFFRTVGDAAALGLNQAKLVDP